MPRQHSREQKTNLFANEEPQLFIFSVRTKTEICTIILLPVTNGYEKVKTIFNYSELKLNEVGCNHSLMNIQGEMFLLYFVIYFLFFCLEH